MSEKSKETGAENDFLPQSLSPDYKLIQHRFMSQSSAQQDRNQNSDDTSAMTEAAEEQRPQVATGTNNICVD